MIELPIDWKVDAEGEMPNFNLYTPLPFNESRLVGATQVLPGNVAATHHITTAVVNMPPGTRLGTRPGVARRPRHATTCRWRPKGRAAAVENAGDHAVVEDEDDGGGFGAYIPGAGARVSRPGQARTDPRRSVPLRSLEPALPGDRQARDRAAEDRRLVGNRRRRSRTSSRASACASRPPKASR